MSLVKISDLPVITAIQSNTSNTIFVGVDLPTNITGRITANVLARGLFSNEVLNVGNNAVLFPNVIGQFASSSNTYLQINLQNFNSNGSSDFVASASDSDNSNSYIDFGISGKTYSDPVYGAFKAYDSYLYGYGPSATSYQGNLIIGTASTRANIVFIAGGLGTDNIVGRISNSAFDFLKPLSVTGNLTASNVRTTGSFVFSDGTTQTTAATGSALSSQAAFDKANNTFTHANAAFNLANVDFLHANAAFNLANVDFIHANAAFNKANSALANTSGIFQGNLDVRGNIIAYSIATSNITSFISSVTPSTNALVEIIGSEFGAQQTPSNDGYMLHVTGKPNTATRLVVDAFGTGNNYALLAGRSGRGTAATPTATQNNDVLIRISGNGYRTTGFAPLGVGRIDIIASENYTDSSCGSTIKFYNTSVGTNVVSEIASFNANDVHFSGTVMPSKGFVYTPRILSGAQTAITINFSSDSIIRATFNSTLTVSFSNYTAGKIVDIWVTNTAGNGQTINLGTLANNSTTGSTTLSVASGRSAKLQYFSIDGDQANTFVAVTYA